MKISGSKSVEITTVPKYYSGGNIIFNFSTLKSLAIKASLKLVLFCKFAEYGFSCQETLHVCIFDRFGSLGGRESWSKFDQNLLKSEF